MKSDLYSAPRCVTSPLRASASATTNGDDADYRNNRIKVPNVS